MNKTTKIGVFTAIILIFITAVNCPASSVNYLPDVTAEMSYPSFWTNETDVLMSYDEIVKLNEETLVTKGANMYDLKNQPETVDGIALNESILKSSQADASYYLGWTYLESNEKATQEEYDKIIENTQNPDATQDQKVLYGIAVKKNGTSCISVRYCNLGRSVRP